MNRKLNNRSLCFILIFSSVNDDSRSMRSSAKHSPSKLPHADLVKWQGSLLRAPLLRLPMDLTPLALECFDCILRYCGDQPLEDLSEVKCVYTGKIIIPHLLNHIIQLLNLFYCSFDALSQTFGTSR